MLARGGGAVRRGAAQRAAAAAPPRYWPPSPACRRSAGACCRGAARSSGGGGDNGGGGGAVGAPGAAAAAGAAAVGAAAAGAAAAAPRAAPRLLLRSLGSGSGSVEAAALLDGVDTLIFDCDGVLWTGSATVPYAPDALRALRARGKRLRFVTNNSSKSREQYVAKFRGLGIEAEAGEVCVCARRARGWSSDAVRSQEASVAPAARGAGIPRATLPTGVPTRPTCAPPPAPAPSKKIVSSSYAAAAYLKTTGFGVTRQRGKKALLLGPEGTALELAVAGVPFVTARELGLPVLDSPDAMLAVEVCVCV
jgi:hypothetical protein